MEQKIAIIEDEPHIAQNYRDACTKRGFKVALYNNKSSALAGLVGELLDLVIIDIGLGHEYDAGFEICTYLRARSKTLPIVFLTARDSDADELSGFRLGADDYLSKDIPIENVMTRVSALLRRVEAYRELDNNQYEIVHGDMSLNEECLRVKWKNQVVDLSVTEFWIVKALAVRPGHVKSKEALMDAAKTVCQDNTIASHIRRIRKKFTGLDTQFNQIETMHLAGYRWRAS